MNTAIDPRTKDDPSLVDQLLGQVDIRVDIVRMDVYRLFINAKSFDDVYFDEVLNRFISAAQAPLNFAIYDRQGSLLFHLVNDPKYHEEMTTKLKGTPYFDKSFDLFPNLLGGEYRILVLHMNSKMATKKNWFDTITFSDKLNKWESRELEFEVKNTKIRDEKLYLERAAWRFFNCPWDGFETHLYGYARKAIVNSIERLAENFRPCCLKLEDADWPPELKTLSQDLEDIALPNTQARAEGWHNKLRKILYRNLRDSASGLNAQHLLMHDKEGKSENTSDVTPNMLVAYRTFSRSHNAIRGRIDKDKGYLYDTQFLIPDMLESKGNFIWDMFENLQAHSQFFESNHKNTYNKTGSRMLYRDVFSKEINENEFGAYFSSLSEDKQEETHGVYRHVTEKLDEIFWKLIASPGGVAKCVEIFRSPVGDDARSLADSAYHTGLIHTNFVFDYAGLDRIAGLKNTPTIEEANLYIEKNKHDLLRIVMFFYTMSEMVNWNGSIEGFDPRKIAAVLMPVKMRGAVWAITIHATYVQKLEENYKDLAYWLSYYHLTTTLALKTSRSFDQVLWENTQSRVAHTLEECLIEFPKLDEIRKAYDEFNLKMKGEQRLVPYALPKIMLGASPETTDGHIVCEGIDGEEYALCWDIDENPFYTGAQRWNHKGTRSFESSIRNGLDRGYENQIWN